MVRRTIAALALGLAACSEQDSCFAGVALISTPSGRRRIRELAVGDEVWSFDPIEKRFAVGTIKHIHRARGEVRSVRTARGAIGAVTASHPLFVASRASFAADVKVGETLLAWDDNPDAQPIATPIVELAPAAPGDTIEVFNLTVDGAFSTYFADGFFVHNKTPVPTCASWEEMATLKAEKSELCVGEKTALAVTNLGIGQGCYTEEEFAKRVVLATSDPSIVGLDGRTAIALKGGSAMIDLLIAGQKKAAAIITVTACTTDAAVEDAATTDATSEVSVDADAAD
jgi:hypothetical protein